MASLRIRLDRLTKALDNVVGAADEAIAACRAVPVPDDDQTLLDLVGVRKRLAGQAESSSDAATLPIDDVEPALPHKQPLRSPNPLLKLPCEIRNQIYESLFASTKLVYGKRIFPDIPKQRMKPASNSLAILRACRLINKEAGAIWLNLVLFSFETIEDALDKLSPLPAATLAQIRNLRLGGRSMKLRSIGYADDVCSRLVWTLKLLPELRLNKLTVLGRLEWRVAYDTLDGMIKYGHGWEELHFLTPNSNMLGFANFEPYWRKPQPKTWNDVLLKRDGADSGSTVTIYIATQPDTPGAVLNPSTRQFIEQGPCGKNTKSYWDGRLLSSSEGNKELLVIVKRGRHVDIGEQANPRYPIGQDIRRWQCGQTWAEVRHQYLSPVTKDENEEVEVDTYKDVDEYSWNAVV
ncbi:hypothetical protein PHISP_01202 [Aspergillus sp. HF37]|nr:hypothetical protein PHISP_01202 [Aspergillus sp. HF37]